jgi:hypothetical protein
MLLVCVAVVSLAHGQDTWNQPASLGTYSPVVAGGYPDIYQDDETAAQVSPSDLNPAPPANATAKPPSVVQREMQLDGFDMGNSCQPCQTASYPAGYGAGCDSSESDCESSGGRRRLLDGHGFGRRYGRVRGACESEAGLGAGLGAHSYLDANCTVANRSEVNTVFGVTGLVFRRDLEDDRGLSYSPGGASLFSTDSDWGTAGGAEVMLGRRRCNGFGWEARYWELFPDQSDIAFTGTPVTVLTGLSDIYHTPSASSVSNLYDRATTHRLYRDNDISNFELNTLRNGGSFACGQGSYELLGGFRWFEFDEDLRYATNSTWPGHPIQFNYDTSVANTLLGAQFGGRAERCLGLFNNRIRHYQRMYDAAGGTDAQIFAGPYNGTAYNIRSDKNDVAMLGELNAGLWYLVCQNFRVGVGYRAIGVSGIALAADQIPYNFTDLREIERINSNGSLLLHGATVGVQYSF